VLSLYDSYILAFRWASDRLKDKGVIAFITNNSFIDTKSSEGLRKCWTQEFNHIYVMNLRGAIRQKSGDLARKEGNNVFDIMTGVAIVILVKDSTNIHEVNYHDIGDYLNRNQKFNILTSAQSVSGIIWDKIVPDRNNDWINQRDDNFEKYQALSDEETSYFHVKDIGIVTNRDAWVSNFSQKNLTENVAKMIENYNLEIDNLYRNKSRILKELEAENKKLDDKTIAKYITTDEKKVSWSRSLKQKAVRGLKTSLDKDSFFISMYRPFTKKYLYRNKFLNENVRKTYQTFPTSNHENLLINVPGPGYDGNFSTIITNVPVVMDGTYKARNFPKYIYNNDDNLFGGKENNIENDNDFYYIYAVLHIPEYRQIFSKDLRKVLPRIPQLKNKEKFIEIGKKLADLHLEYETQSSWSGVTVTGEEVGNFKVKKIKHPKVRNAEGKSVNDLTRITFSENITISNIPEEAYEYVVNGRSAIEWIINQYQVKTDKKSGIVDDPNEFSDNPRYILDLLLSVITVSMKTVELVGQLPEMENIDE
jgi:predicted helicase